MTQGSRHGSDALAEARETISRQAEEIDHLRGQLADEQFAQDLRARLVLASTAGTVAAPVTRERLLELIVEAAAQVISARGASLFLIDEEKQELAFEVALGKKAKEVGKFRVPLGHGIAGLVAVSGQAMAVSDAENDPRQASDISERIGYWPRSLLCVPLFYGDQVIGVLELLDKDGAESFTVRDMELLGVFANLAGVAIEQSRTQQNVTALIENLVHSVGDVSGEQQGTLLPGARDFALHMQDGDTSYRQAIEIAQLVHAIVSEGGEASRAVLAILRGFVEYLQSGHLAESGMSW
ncbi:MAG: GAF domain-containing protein [Chloroflexota bacterium]|nr:MAG: hypothetical protein DLM70_19055 [Chloroflexota bacterium]